MHTQIQILAQVMDKSKAIANLMANPSIANNLALTQVKAERSKLMGQLNKPKLVAVGTSCSDCAFCVSYEAKYPEDKKPKKESFCSRFEYEETTVVREKEFMCGPMAQAFIDVKEYSV